MCKKKLELILQKFAISCKMIVLHRHTKIMCFSSTSTGLPHSLLTTHSAYLLPYTPRAWPTTLLTTLSIYCTSADAAAFHSPTLTLRQTMRRSRSATQVAHNEKCRMQKKNRQNAVGIETETPDMWNTASHRPNLRSSFLSFCSVCVNVLCLYCLLIGNFILCKFLPRSAHQTSVGTHKHMHLQRRVGVSSDCDGDRGFLCILFFNEMCVVVVKSAVAVWRHLYFYKIPLIITHTLTHTNEHPLSWAWCVALILVCSLLLQEQQAIECNANTPLTHSLAQGLMYCVGSKSVSECEHNTRGAINSQ